MIWKKGHTPVFGGIRSEFPSLEVQDQYSNVWKDKARILVVEG